MILPDVNVLVYALRPDASPAHDAYRSWLEQAVNGQEPLGLSEGVLSGVVRILTHPKIFDPPSNPEDVLDRLDELRSEPNVVLQRPGPRHWEIFDRLVRQSGARGNLVADAYHAALAIESGSTWVTTDGDFARFSGLRTTHPLRG